MDARKEVDANRSGFERLVGQIPGYKGYKTKELAREADYLLRQALGRGLSQGVQNLEEAQREAFDRRWLSILDDLASLSRQLQTLADMVRTASYGYTGLFDAVKVKEERLEAVYAHDAALLDQLVALRESLDRVVRAAELDVMQTALAQARTAVRAFWERWDEREAILHGEPGPHANE